MEEFKNIKEILDLAKEDLEKNNKDVSAILDYDDLKSLQKLFYYVDTMQSEFERLENIEDEKIQIEYENVFGKGVKSVEDKIKKKIKQLEEKIKGIIEKEKDVEDYQCEEYYEIQILKEILRSK